MVTIHLTRTDILDGAGLFYTAPTQPQTYTLLRQYLLHRLYTVAPPLNPSPNAPPPPATAFPFSHRANVLDRDAVMVPTGWDSHGKINVLRDRFDPMRVLKAWENSLSSLNNPNDDSEEGETVEDMWIEMIPDTSKPKVCENRLSREGCLTISRQPRRPFLQLLSPNNPSSLVNSKYSKKTPTEIQERHSEQPQRPYLPRQQEQQVQTAVLSLEVGW